MRKPVIAGNWKMYKLHDEALNTALDLKSLVVSASYPVWRLWIINKFMKNPVKSIKRSLVIAILIIISSFSILAQTEGKVSLIVTYTPDNETEFLERVIKFNFLKGELISQKVLFTINVEKDGHILGMYKNRYIFTHNTTDIKKRIDEQKTFDLETEQFIDRRTIPFEEQITPGIFRLKSPDGKKSINLDNYPQRVESLTIYVEGKKDLIVKETFSATTSNTSSIIPILPVIWIDNERILTQKSNGNLVVVTLDGKISPFLVLPCKADEFPRFRKTRVGTLIYNCSGEEFQIDIKNTKYEKIKNDLDYNFSEKDSLYYYEDREIGESGQNEETTEGYIAVVTGKTRNRFFDSNDLNTIKIWNKFTKKWKVFNLDGSQTEILGWFHEIDS